MTASSALADDRFEPPACNHDPGHGAPDHALLFKADRSGLHTLRASGEQSLIMYVRSGCGGAELACDDEDERGPAVTLALVANEQVLVIVDGLHPIAFCDFRL